MLIAASAPITWNATAQESPELPPAPEVQKAPAGDLRPANEKGLHKKGKAIDKKTARPGQKHAGIRTHAQKRMAFKNDARDDFSRGQCPCKKMNRHAMMDRGPKMMKGDFHSQGNHRERRMRRG